MAHLELPKFVYSILASPVVSPKNELNIEWNQSNLPHILPMSSLINSLSGGVLRLH